MKTFKTLMIFSFLVFNSSLSFAGKGDLTAFMTYKFTRLRFGGSDDHAGLLFATQLDENGNKFKVVKGYHAANAQSINSDYFLSINSTRLMQDKIFEKVGETYVLERNKKQKYCSWFCSSTPTPVKLYPIHLTNADQAISYLKSVQGYQSFKHDGSNCYALVGHIINRFGDEGSFRSIPRRLQSEVYRGYESFTLYTESDARDLDETLPELSYSDSF